MIKSVAFVLLVWNVDKPVLDHLTPRLGDEYRKLASETNLQRWKPDKFKATKYILPGYGGR